MSVSTTLSNSTSLDWGPARAPRPPPPPAPCSCRECCHQIRWPPSSSGPELFRPASRSPTSSRGHPERIEAFRSRSGANGLAALPVTTDVTRHPNNRSPARV